jgi:hypothetical protein
MLKHIGSHALFRGAIILVIGVISSLAFIGIPLPGATQIWRPFTGRVTADCGLT